MKMYCLACRPHPAAAGDRCPEMVLICVGGSQYVAACPQCTKRVAYLELGHPEQMTVYQTLDDFKKATRST